MQTLREIIADAEERRIAIGHFNISDSTQLQAIVKAAQEVGGPVIIGTSEGEREFIGPEQAAALVHSVHTQQGFPFFINADHTHSVEKIEEAVRAGYDMVIIDAADAEFSENVERTKEAVQKAKAINPDVLVEGELGYIGSSSKLRTELPEGAAVTKEEMTTPEEAERFVAETGVDLLAPAVGNIHGQLRDGRNPNLDTERISALREAAGVPLVLHGGSGISDDDFRKAIAAGIAIVHVNTELRVAYREGIEEGLKENPDEIAPYRYINVGRDKMQEVVARRIALFAGENGSTPQVK